MKVPGKGQKNLMVASLEVQVVYCGRTPEQAASFFRDAIDEWLASDPNPWRYRDVDGHHFRIRPSRDGGLEIQREETNDEN